MLQRSNVCLFPGACLWRKLFGLLQCEPRLRHVFNRHLRVDIRTERKRRATARAWDPRLHGIGAQILKDLNVGKMRVLARPKRIPSMAGFGLEVVEYVSPDDAVSVKAV